MQDPEPHKEVFRQSTPVLLHGAENEPESSPVSVSYTHLMGESIGYDGYRLADKQIGTINLEIVDKYYASLATIYSAETIKKEQDKTCSF